MFSSLGVGGEVGDRGQVEVQAGSGQQQKQGRRHGHIP